jgi:hypothetical protein
MLEILFSHHSTRLSWGCYRDLCDLGSPSSRELSLKFGDQTTARCSGVQIDVQKDFGAAESSRENQR